MRKMKDSGIEWIGQIPENWRIEKAKHIFVSRKEKGNANNLELLSPTQKYGVIPQSKYQEITGMKPVQVSEEADLSDFRTVHAGDFCISLSAYMGGFEYSKYEGVISPAYTAFHKTCTINDRYYMYLFKSVTFIDEINRITPQSVRVGRTTPYEKFAQVVLPIPPTDVQSRIADYLDDKCGEIDQYIEKQQQIIEKLKAYKQAVITEAVTKGLDPTVPMKDSGIEWIGMIPAHWSVAKLANLFSFIGGYAFNSDTYVPETNNQIIRIGNVKNDLLLFDSNPVYISGDLANQVARFRLQADDILFTMTGTKGKRDYFYTLIIDNSHLQTKELYLNQRVGCFRKKGEIYPTYYNYLLKDSRILDSIFLYETGTANQGNLGIETINRTKVHFPPYDEQVAISLYLSKKCEAVDKAISKREDVIKNFTEYKKSLIYEAVTGKKEV